MIERVLERVLPERMLPERVLERVLPERMLPERVLYEGCYLRGCYLGGRVWQVEQSTGVNTAEELTERLVGERD